MSNLFSTVLLAHTALSNARLVQRKAVPKGESDVSPTSIEQRTDLPQCDSKGVSRTSSGLSKSASNGKQTKTLYQRIKQWLH